MNKYIIYLCAIITLASCATSETISNIDVRLVDLPVCKNNQTRERLGNNLMTRSGAEDNSTMAGEVESLTLSYVNGDSLQFFHENMEMNCAAIVKINHEVDGNSNTIIIDEDDISEYSAHCLCPYDVKLMIGSLMQGTYKLILKKYGHVSKTIDFEFKPDMNYHEVLEVREIGF